MRQTILAAAAAFVIGGIATGAMLTQAQPAPPQSGPAADGGAPQQAHHWMGWGHHSGMEHRAYGGPVAGMRAFALIYRQEDRALAPTDVQKIAEAFLLWNGNHSWKVTDVAPTSDGLIGFSLTTGDGSVIAKFTMDPHSAKLIRMG